MTLSSLLERWGCNREDFEQVAWLTDDVLDSMLPWTKAVRDPNGFSVSEASPDTNTGLHVLPNAARSKYWGPVGGCVRLTAGVKIYGAANTTAFKSNRWTTNISNLFLTDECKVDKGYVNQRKAFETVLRNKLAATEPRVATGTIRLIFDRNSRWWQRITWSEIASVQTLCSRLLDPVSRTAGLLRSSTACTAGIALLSLTLFACRVCVSPSHQESSMLSFSGVLCPLLRCQLWKGIKLPELKACSCGQRGKSKNVCKNCVCEKGKRPCSSDCGCAAAAGKTCCNSQHQPNV
jgi:hypothetical protein